jgi:hypothetical protein
MPNDTGQKPPMSGAQRSRRWRERHRQRGSTLKKPPEVAAAPSARTGSKVGAREVGACEVGACEVGARVEFDPLEVLRSIAADQGAPAAARVAACRTLIGQEGPGSADPRRKVDELALRFLRSIN